MRHLAIVLGDQLNLNSALWDDFDPAQDAVWMAEVPSEATYVWSHKCRIAIFLSAMRHYRQVLRQQGFNVLYRQMDDPENRGDFMLELRDAIQKYRPRKLVLVEPGEWRVRELFVRGARDLGIELQVLPDRHFLCSTEEFSRYAKGRKQLRLEYFYREMRRKHRVLMNGAQPWGGRWNYDPANRAPFPAQGPGVLPSPRRFPPDPLTRQVIQLVEDRFSEHPGELRHFDWPVTAEEARAALDDFIRQRLPQFGEYQDAMWSEEPYLFHSRLSAALNLKLLDPREVIQAAESAYHAGHAPLNAVEGFIRQILGWREYVRGIYWTFMPGYLERNALRATLPLPKFYWTGETEMACLRQVIGQTLDFGYAHHIQRLMVTGLFALLLGVEPRAVHEWYLAVYVDAVEWVELPNTLGMSQFADGGVMASKPYAATGKYIQRMSNYCRGCRYKPDRATGHDACPFTTLYWDFLMRHRQTLAANPRMSLQVKNLERKSKDELREIRSAAEALRQRWSQ